MDITRKILVVDDDPVVGKSFDRVLASKGYAVITAENGEEALRKLDAEHYDVVFTDIKMPGMNGLEVAERVRASQPWLPVVIVTGYGSGANEERAEAAGVSAFLRKPLSPEMIEASTAKALADRAAEVSPGAAALATPVIAPPPLSPEVPTVSQPPAGRRETLKNIALFLAAPFIGLAYVVAMPFVALGTLGWLAAKAAVRRFPALKNIAFFFAAPMIGLGYIVAMPFVGIGLLAWFGSRALLKRN